MFDRPASRKYEVIALSRVDCIPTDLAWWIIDHLRGSGMCTGYDYLVRNKSATSEWPCDGHDSRNSLTMPARQSSPQLSVAILRAIDAMLTIGLRAASNPDTGNLYQILEDRDTSHIGTRLRSVSLPFFFLVTAVSWGSYNYSLTNETLLRHHHYVFPIPHFTGRICLPE